MLKVEDDIKNGRVKDAREVLKNGKSSMKYRIKLTDEFWKNLREYTVIFLKNKNQS